MAWAGGGHPGMTGSGPGSGIAGLAGISGMGPGPAGATGIGGTASGLGGHPGIAGGAAGQHGGVSAGISGTGGGYAGGHPGMVGSGPGSGVQGHGGFGGGMSGGGFGGYGGGSGGGLAGAAGSAFGGSKGDFGGPSIGSAMFGSTFGKNDSSGYGGRADGGFASGGRAAGDQSYGGFGHPGMTGNAAGDRGRGSERGRSDRGYSGPQSMPSDRGIAVAQLGPALGNAVADMAARRGHSAFGFGDHPMAQPTDLAGVRSADTHGRRQSALGLAAMNALAPNADFTDAMNQLGPQALTALIAREGITEGPTGMSGVMASMMNRAMAQEEGASRHLGNINNMGTMYSALNDAGNRVTAPVGSQAFEQAVRGAILGTQQDIPAVPPAVQNASHYFAQNTVTPNWADDSFTQFGRHTFGNTAPAPSAERMAGIRGERFGGLGGNSAGIGGRGR